MTPNLKTLRAKSGLTQKALAEAAETTTSTYQKWEAGKLVVPANKVRKLAAALGVNVGALKTKSTPVLALPSFCAAPELSHYGEVAFHFIGGGKPLLLSISEDAHKRLYRDLQGDSAFIEVESLSNQLVAIRRDALSDTYLSSEAYDDFGPEHGDYDLPSDLLLVENEDWDIVESLMVGLDTSDFNEERVEAVSKMLDGTSKEEFIAAVESGSMTDDEVAEEKEREERRYQLIHELATETKVQLSNGKVRNFSFAAECDLYEGFSLIFQEAYELSDGPLIVKDEGGYHRSFFINTSAIDYVSVPKHSYMRGMDRTFELDAD